MWKFFTLLVRFFGKMADFINPEKDYVHCDVIDDCEKARQTVSNNEFFDDETQLMKI